jgi:hypothetical protein
MLLLAWAFLMPLVLYIKNPCPCPQARAPRPDPCSFQNKFIYCIRLLFDEMKQIQKHKPAWIIVVFALFLLVLLFSLVKALLEGSHFAIDTSCFIVSWVLLFFYYQRLGIKGWVILLVALALFMSIAGLYNAYNLVFVGIGYDKYLHIVTAFAATLALFQVFMNRKHKSFQGSLILAFLVMAALSSFSEIGEFIGTIYFGVTQGFLAMPAGEAYYPVSDLVR